MLVAQRGGLACMRFKYREPGDFNTIQTLCVVAFDEIGSCDGLERLNLDLNQFIDSTPQLAGNANLLEAGQGEFYSACLTADGSYRLQQAEQQLPPLYFVIVDAMVDFHPYALGQEELAAQRAGVVVTHSGEEILPPWIIPVSRELEILQITEDLSIEINTEDCDVVPSCSYSEELVHQGDILMISYGATPEMFQKAIDDVSPELRERYVQEKISISWDDIAAAHPDLAPRAFARLASLDIMGQLLEYFDDLYNLREKGIRVAYRQYWFANAELSNTCFPDEAEQAFCEKVEASIQAEETKRISQWQAEGFHLWHTATIDYRGEGEYYSYASYRPHFSNFEGVLAGIGANSSATVENIPQTLANNVIQFAEEIGTDMPVILHLLGPPISAQTGSEFCEGDICPSDFKGMYEQAEAALLSALENLSPQQFQGYGIALFEGSHFDIREPHEAFEHFTLNRVGETGYNNPVLNIYRSK